MVTHSNSDTDFKKSTLIIKVQNSIRNPSTSKQSSYFEIYSYLLDQETDQYFLVDQDLDSVTVQANTPNTFQQVTVTRSETEISKETSLTVCMTPTNPIPEMSVLTIEFPADQVLVSSMIDQIFSQDDTVFTVLQKTSERQVVLLPDSVAASEEYCFTMTGGLVNPETTRPPTDSFLVSIKTGESHWVDETDEGIYA